MTSSRVTANRGFLFASRRLRMMTSSLLFQEHTLTQRSRKMKFHVCGLESERNKANKIPFRNFNRTQMHTSGAHCQHMLQIFLVISLLPTFTLFPRTQATQVSR